MDDLDAAQNHAGAAKVPRSEHRMGASFDGSMSALDNIVQVLRGWADSSWIRMMPDNQDLNQAPSEQRVMEGDPKFEVPYRYFAALIVLDGIYVDGAERRAQHGTKQSPQFVRRSST